jgi:hypothetical protein
MRASFAETEQALTEWDRADATTTEKVDPALDDAAAAGLIESAA